MANSYVMVRVDPVTKALWVDAAHGERVSLSEWVRRRCDDGLAAGVGTGPSDLVPGGRGEDRSPAVSPSLPVSVREFRPDPKKKP